VKSFQEHNELLKDLHIPAFGYELIRQVVFPSIFGKNTSFILYWAGKDLARKYPLQTLEEIISFFEKAGWGTLTLLDEKKDEYEFELNGPLVSARFDWDDSCTFQLEAGFLAQQIEQQKGKITEAYEQQKKRAKTVHFTVKWDRKDDVK
jgi:predicted hydrocarbon binding protein